MLRYQEALDRLLALEVPAQRERLPLARCAGRALAEEVRLDRDQPAFDRATMDGFALALDGGRDRFELVGSAAAGQGFEGRLRPGQAVRIFTGAPCPPGVTVVPIELTRSADREVHVLDPDALRPGRNIAWRGEDGRAGELVLESGRLLGPAQLAAAAMAGAEELLVFRAARVGIVTTGDEVGGAGPAGIRDSNGPMLAAFLQALGSPFERHHARDEEEPLRRALAEAGAGRELVVTTGGVSMGNRDLVPGAIEALGYRTLFHKVAIQPGKPVLVARHPEGRLFLGLPGNPVSVLATAHLFLLPVLRLFLGSRQSPWISLPLAADCSNPRERHLFLPARLEPEGVVPVRWNGSGDLLAAASADGFVSLPPQASWKSGERIGFLTYVGHQRGERALLPPRSERSS
jgi:molybdopterin molybdotransferase